MTNPSEGSFPFRTSITKEEIADMPSYSYEGRITLIDSLEKVKAYANRFQGDATLGFDTETKPSFQKGQQNQCSLVQLATADEVALFRLNHVGFPEILKEILTQQNAMKIGIAIHDDLKHLKAIDPFEPINFIDLNKACPAIGFESIGAKRLSALVLGKRISKKQQVSNWEARELTDAQLRYAATDAWICREIYLTLESKGLFNRG